MLTIKLVELIAQARATANPGVQWVMIGGRSCPIGWDHCSQPVFESTCGRYTDYGNRGGPGDTSCRTECPNGYKPPLEDL